MKKVYLLSLLTVLFVGLVILIKTNSFVALDTSIGKAVYSIHDLGMVSVLKWIGMLGSTTGIIIVLFLFMIIFAFITKSFVPPVILFSSVLIGNIGNKLLKALIERERPSFVDHMEDGFSFPSGHVMVGLLLFGMIAYYLAGASHSKRMKQTIISSACILLLLIGLSRLLEGEHFITDVIGGFIAGGIFLLGMIAIDKIVHTKISERKVQKDVAL
ncbi:phosphatase PAP2 family protein [Metabacillus sediminilitoris]|uniref:Phosphatase PAP2 family protein n=1 Tax=Metabacillus sediminilitoris TaxID=2567941 RepID=A0A4S4BZI0_9BACI|nr:phosphatase PAP2 family protein [Metabacillus sediminilitoris]QGQ44540.1 phosphatase PAP2 family protein [Metabacillus sediminilitoris]THF80165.1 phosphatase PAP2 family protein [Metabacillus sediminilitoris]